MTPLTTIADAGGNATGTLSLRYYDIGSLINVRVTVTKGDIKLMTLKTVRLE